MGSSLKQDFFLWPRSASYCLLFFSLFLLVVFCLFPLSYLSWMAVYQYLTRCSYTCLCMHGCNTLKQWLTHTHIQLTLNSHTQKEKDVERECERDVLLSMQAVPAGESKCWLKRWKEVSSQISVCQFLDCWGSPNVWGWGGRNRWPIALRSINVKDATSQNP